jgi:hypothetical protein
MMIELIVPFLAGSIATGLAVLPYAIGQDRKYYELIDQNEQQAHALANAQALMSNGDQQIVDAAVRRVEDAAVIQRLERIIEVSQAEVASLTEQLVIQSRASKAAANQQGSQK